MRSGIRLADGLAFVAACGLLALSSSGCGTVPIDPADGLDPVVLGETVYNNGELDTLVGGEVASGTGRVLLYWDRHGEFTPGQPLALLSDNPYLDGAVVAAVWGEIEPERGVFDFGILEAEIAWWAERGKRVLLHTGPYALATARPPTPDWIYDEGVEAIEFQPDPRKAYVATLPKVWESPAFLTLYGEFVAALAERYDDDPRVDHVWIGVGHLGYTTACAARGGATALPAAGWTPQKWEDYIDDMVDLFASHFTQTPTVLAASPGWLVNYKESTTVPAMERIAQYAVEQGASLMMNGLDTDPDVYARRPFSEMLDSIADATLPPDFTLFMRDDWPLWVDEERRESNSWEADRDEQGFVRALLIARDEWDRLGRQCDFVLVLLTPEVQASTPEHPDYEPAVAAILEACKATGS